MLVLYLFGGSPMIPGLQNFEIFEINPTKKSWSKIQYNKPIIQTLGSRPVYQKLSSEQFSLVQLSGMVPSRRINEGVKVCTPDVNTFDSIDMSWQQLRCHSQSDIPIVGRKNHAISYVDDQIFVTGGVDNGHKLLSEFIILDPLTGEWIELKQTRNKNKSKL